MEVANQIPTLGSSLLTDAASSSFALATPSGVSVAAKRANEEQTEGLAAERLSFGTVNDKNPRHAPDSTGHSILASKLDPEVLESVFSSNGIQGGDIFCPNPPGYRPWRNDVNLLHESGRIRETRIEDDEIKFERPGSDSKYRTKRYYDEKINDLTVELRQVLSNFGKKPDGKIMDDGIMEEVLKLRAAKLEKIDMILYNTSYTKTLRTMHFQRANMTLKSKFCSIGWRKDHRFPKFRNGGADYQWWEQNFDPEILEKRLEIFQEAAKNWNPELDMFMIIELVSDLNSRLHPEPGENKLHEKDEVKMSRLLTTICSLRSGGDSKI